MSKELCELGLELSQLERVQARLRLRLAGGCHCQRGVQLILLAPEELSVLTRQQTAKC